MALSLLVGSGWLLTEAYPSEMEPSLAGCLHFAVIGLLGTVAARRTGWGGWNGRSVAGVALAGVAAFVLPGLVAALTSGPVSQSASLVLYCAVPLMMVLGVAASGEGSGRKLLTPSLVGLSGALLLFSVELPVSLRGAVALAAVAGSCALAAGANVWMHRLTQEVSTAAVVAVVGVAGAVVLGSYGSRIGWPQMAPRMVGLEAVRCVVFDLPVVWMTVWLMREVSPVRLAARYVLAPVVTWLESYAMVRGTVELRSVVALVLMVAGAGMLLVKDESEEVPGLRLR